MSTPSNAQEDVNNISLNNKSEPEIQVKSSKSSKIYAVTNGRQTGLFTSWDLCQLSVNKYSGAKYSSFKNVKLAQKFMSDNGYDPSDVKIFTSLEESPILLELKEISEHTECEKTNIVVENTETFSISQAVINEKFSNTAIENHTTDTQGPITTYIMPDQIPDKLISDTDSLPDTDIPDCLLNPEPETPTEIKPKSTVPVPEIIKQQPFGEMINQCDENKLQDPAIDLPIKFTEILTSINRHLDFSEEIHKLEDKLINKLTNSEKVNTDLRIQIVQNDLDHANGMITHLKKELSKSESKVQTADKISEKYALLEIAMEQQKSSYQLEINKLDMKYKMLCLKVENLETNKEQSSAIIRNLQSDVDLWKARHDVKSDLLEKYESQNSDLSNKISSLQDEIFALKLQGLTNYNDKEYSKPKVTSKPHTDQSPKSIAIENRFAGLEKIEIPVTKENPLPTPTTQKLNGNKDPDQQLSSEAMKPTQTGKSAPETNTSTDESIDVLFIGNSHVSKIDTYKLYKNKNCVIHCLEAGQKDIVGAENYIKRSQVSDPKIIVFQVASNNLESLSAELCTNEIKALVNLTENKYPHSKICIGEALPRELQTVRLTNTYLEYMKTFNRNITKIRNIHVVKHRNIDLRQRNLWSDNIHLSEIGMARFIRNFKFLLNPLLNMKPYEEYWRSTNNDEKSLRYDEKTNDRQMPYNPQRNNMNNSMDDFTYKYSNYRSMDTSPSPFPNSHPKNYEYYNDDQCDLPTQSRSAQHWKHYGDNPSQSFPTKFLDDIDALVKRYRHS